jgi:hypothetical protein
MATRITMAAVTALCAALMLCGCETTRLVYHDDLPAFLTSPDLTREAVTERLGPPTRLFDNDHVLTYRLRQRGQTYAAVQQYSGWKDLHASLVIVVDDEGHVLRHALVRVRQ